MEQFQHAKSMIVWRRPFRAIHFDIQGARFPFPHP